jgi:tetratricopeptide (TPR) repeat protein
MVLAKVWQIYDDIGYTACTTGNLKLAEQMFTLAIESCASKRSMKEQRLKSLIGLADTMLLSNRRAECSRLYNRVINLLAREGTANDHERYMLAHALEKQAYIRFEEKQDEEAVKLLQRSMRLLERIYGSVHDALVPRLLQLSRMHAQMKNTDQSLACLTRARRIQTESDRSSHQSD